MGRMKNKSAEVLSCLLYIILAHVASASISLPALPPLYSNFTTEDKRLIGVALNLEYFEAEFFLFGSFGMGLDYFAPQLTGGGPAPTGGQKALLDPATADVFGQLGLQEVGHIRAIKGSIEEEAFERPQLNISKSVWEMVFNSALNTTLFPPFDVYANSVNFYLASYVIPYVGLTGYAGVSPLLEGIGAKSLVARLLGVEAGQDAVIRAWLYERRDQFVVPYSFTIAQVTDKLSKLRNSLDHGSLDDEGLVVAKKYGSEGMTMGNILSADANSLAYTRTPRQIFSVVYTTGDASKPGGFYPRGGNGTIAKNFLGETYP